MAERVRDVIGIGLGPANLALAVALEEHPWQPHAPLFLERSPSFAWHTGMLFEEATMQVSFLKDVATLRNPRSAYTFLSYLHDRGRLVDFINLKDFFPTRVEFHDYLEWVAASFSDVVRYDCCVQLVLPVVSEGVVRAFDVVVDAAGRDETIRTKNVVVACGLTPRMPDGIKPTDRIWHSSEVLHRLAEVEGSGDARSFVVVGAGQSAAEVAAHLHTRFRDAHVHAVLPRYGYSVADDSPFVNRVFDPSAVDDFFAAPSDVKERFYAYHRNTNYSVVDADLIEDLYRRAYREMVTGDKRLHIMPMSEVVAVEERPHGVHVRIQSRATGAATDVRADAAVFATGYEQMDPGAILGPAAELCLRTPTGEVRVRRDYRVETAPEVSAGIYLQGATEHTHGISTSLLSNVAVRAWDVVESLAANTR